MAMEIDGLDRIRLEKCADRLLVLLASVFPVSVAQAVPYFRKSVHIRVRVLNHQPFQPFWVFVQDAKSDRATVILHVQAELREVECGEQSFDRGGSAVKRV